jgi:hypothetical protein
MVLVGSGWFWVVLDNSAWFLGLFWVVLGGPVMVLSGSGVVLGGSVRSASGVVLVWFSMVLRVWGGSSGAVAFLLGCFCGFCGGSGCLNCFGGSGVLGCLGDSGLVPGWFWAVAVAVAAAPREDPQLSLQPKLLRCDSAQEAIE